MYGVEMIMLTGYETQEDILVNEGLIVFAERRPEGHTLVHLGGQRIIQVQESPVDILMFMRKVRKKGWI